MGNEKNIKWLYHQLPNLIESGIIDPLTAQKIKAHYGDVNEQPDYNLGFIIAGSLGAVLIGGGIIMLFAYNWENLSLTLRTLFSFLPLLLAQAVYTYVFFKKSDQTAWIEASSGFLMLMLAATLALVSQTYNIMGSETSFLRLWMLLSIPLLYLMNASLPTLFYLVGISAWAANTSGERSVFYWAFLLAAIPHLYRNIRPLTDPVRTNLLAWTILFTLAVAWFNVIEINLSAHLLISTAILLSLFYFLGQRIFPEDSHLINRPFRTFAIGGIFVMTMALGYEWPEDYPSFEEFVLGDRYGRWPALVNFSIVLLAATALLWLIYTSFQNGRLKNYWVASFPLMILAGMGLTGAGQKLMAIVLANIFLLGFGIYYIKEGLQRRRLSIINLGMLFLTAMIVARFFDADLSLIYKGIVFILLGVGFLSVNVVMNRKLKEER